MSMDLGFNITLLLHAVKEFYEKKFPRNTDDVITAITTMNEAVIDTHDYLYNQHGGIYVSNPALARKWNLASAAVRKIDWQLGDLLFNKSRFWTDPKSFVQSGTVHEVMQLEEVKKEIDRLRRKIK